ncbi:hypothetical protein C8R45DRAFT_529091 [Mycena sanguinolenta]|nr:hypothetical protein C8R45DRAFT_529091 [Mycena sanguinolenta]
MHTTEASTELYRWNGGAAPKASPTLSSLLEPLPRLSPELTRLLTSNDAPTDSEIPVIRQIIRDAEARLLALDAHIVYLPTNMAETEKYLSRHRAILSPVRRVPAELICEIFDLATAQSRAEPFGEYPWHLGFICQRWRECALGFPTLWSSLTVDASPTYSPRDIWRLLALETQLLRTAEAPLDIRWLCIANESPDLRMLDLLFPQSRRWRTVVFHPSQSTTWLDWLQPVRGKLDRLQNLELHDAYALTVPDVFATAANLSRVTVRYFPVIHHPPPYQPSLNLIPWEQITHYRGSCPWERQLDILRAAPNLLNCALDISDGDDNLDPATQTAVSLPQLRRLGLGWNTAYALHIVAPRLEEVWSWNSWGTAQILPFVHRASCTLRRLILWECSLEPHLISTFRELSSLTYLLLGAQDGREDRYIDIFAGIRVSGTPEDICPNLTSMAYRSTKWESGHLWDAFVSMARSRFRANAIHPSTTNLTSIRLLSSGSMETQYSRPAEEIEAGVRSLQEEGLNVAFVGESETIEYVDLYADWNW